ncbi:rRNA pseudouridine synthase [Candidatus Parcubacteria bacterium]|nr:rRNA pseudouridine synthase [Candidatus Parcubacteria bacterium]
MRINKYLAHKGLSTRRGADTLIETGKVFINGVRATLGQQIAKDDTVDVRSKHKEYRYIVYNKPRGVITHSPAEGETDILMRLKEDYNLTGLFPIGRLDKDSEGLMIMTDDGRITDRLLNPEHAHERTYEVTVDKPITNQFLRTIQSGMRIERYFTKPAQVEKTGPARCRITLTEGKKHQIRRMCAGLGYQVQQLKRVRILNLAVGDMKPAQYRIIKDAELKEFLKQIGL